MEGLFLFFGFLLFGILTVTMALLNLLISKSKVPGLVFILPSIGLPLSIVMFIFVVIVPFAPFALYLFGGSIALFYASVINIFVSVALFFSKRKRTQKRS